MTTRASWRNDTYLALIIGPFDTRVDADEWCGHAHNPSGGRPGEARVLALRRTGQDFVGLGRTGVADGADAQQAVVMLDTDEATVVYGPFASALDAALFWHDVTGALELTNVRKAGVCELTAPGADARASGAGGTAGWVVRSRAETTTGEPLVVGPFPDARAASAWRASSSHGGSVLPVREP